MKINLPSSSDSHQKHPGQWPTQKLEAKKLGTVVKLDYEKINNIAHETYQSLKAVSPQPNQNKIFVLIWGEPGSGKSSQLLPLAQQNYGPGIKIDLDDIRPKVAEAFRDMKDQNEYQEPLNTERAARDVSKVLEDLALYDGYTIYTFSESNTEENIESISRHVRASRYESHLVCALIDSKVAANRINERNIEVANSSEPILHEQQPSQDLALSITSKPIQTTANELINTIEAGARYGFDYCTVYDTNVDKDVSPILKLHWNTKRDFGNGHYSSFKDFFDHTRKYFIFSCVKEINDELSSVIQNRLAQPNEFLSKKLKTISNDEKITYMVWKAAVEFERRRILQQDDFSETELESFFKQLKFNHKTLTSDDVQNCLSCYSKIKEDLNKGAFIKTPTIDPDLPIQYLGYDKYHYFNFVHKDSEIKIRFSPFD